MARLFDDASSENLEVGTAVVTDFPATFACWFFSDSITINQTLVSIASTGHTNRYTQLLAAGNVSGDPIRARNVRTTAVSADSTTGYSANTWHHACGVFTSSTSRAAFIDGGSKGTDVNSKGFSAVDVNTTSIGVTGASSKLLFMSGRVAEAAIWNAALSDAQVAILGAGYSPLFVRPQSLVAYWPLIRDQDNDRIGANNLTAINTPSVADHVNIIYPAAPYIITAPAAAAAANAPTGHIRGPLWGPLAGPI